ncbi:MAG: MarR family transcriptional regulator [Actinomycetota bacterium]|nr:MarR family transcriptional regulator [Actinomycetota bacterium]
MPASAAQGAQTAAEEAWALFWRIFSDDKPRRMAVMADLGLSFMQSMALSRLEPGVPLPMSALATSMQCDNSNVTGIVDRLEAAGLAERRPAEHDRRVKAILLTEKGEALRGEAMERMGRPPAPIAALSEKDAQALCVILRRAAAHLDGFEGQAT